MVIYGCNLITGFQASSVSNCQYVVPVCPFMYQFRLAKFSFRMKGFGRNLVFKPIAEINVVRFEGQ
jgi:hypothetical protein